MLHLNRQRASESIPASPRELVRFGTHRSRNKNPDGVPGAYMSAKRRLEKKRWSPKSKREALWCPR